MNLRQAAGITGQYQCKELRDKEAAIRAELMPMVRTGHTTLQQHEREVRFALGLSDAKRAEFISLQKAMYAERDDLAEERNSLRAAAGVKIQ